MKMRFWQKTYLMTLALFLLCLNVGIMSLAVYSHGKNVESAEATAKAEQSYIAQSFERDMEDLSSVKRPVLLMQSYGLHYEEKGIQLTFLEEGEVQYPSVQFLDPIGQDQMAQIQVEGKRHIVIRSRICDGDYELVYSKDVSYLDQEFRSLALTYGATALGVSLLMAVGLYFVLKKLSAPLEKLRKTTEQIEAGDYTVTVRARGTDEFALLARSFNKMLIKINRQMDALELDAQRKQMLVDNMAHELRTPLTSIRGYAQFLEIAAASEEDRIMAARYIQSESDRLKKISELLLDSAYIRGEPPQMQTLELSAVLADTAEKLQLRAKNAGVTLHCQARPLMLEGNETLLSMLFYNLTENAIKACKPGGQVRLSCGGFSATVTDDGKGMTDEQLLHITEPFYRTDKSRSRAEGGAGLGLALCRQIVQIHGAVMDFASQPGEGTTVTVTFTTLK